jgi:membrane protein implicated in regulation of membrane protease activity
MESWMWLLVAGLLLVAEMLTVHLLFASLATAALAAALTGFLGGSLAIQGIAFALFAVISLAFIRPIALRHLKRQDQSQATNVDALVGQRALTTSAVDPLGGQVKLSGEIWSARTDAQSIPVGTKVVVVAIEGATVLVREQ